MTIIQIRKTILSKKAKRKYHKANFFDALKPISVGRPSSIGLR